MIELEHITKTFRVQKREAGTKNAIKTFFKRDYQEIKALDEQNYTIRVWVASEIETTNLDLHYHGKIQIIENDSILARR